MALHARSVKLKLMKWSRVRAVSYLTLAAGPRINGRFSVNSDWLNENEMDAKKDSKKNKRLFPHQKHGCIHQKTSLAHHKIFSSKKDNQSESEHCRVFTCPVHAESASALILQETSFPKLTNFLDNLPQAFDAGIWSSSANLDQCNLARVIKPLSYTSDDIYIGSDHNDLWFWHQVSTCEDVISRKNENVMVIISPPALFDETMLLLGDGHEGRQTISQPIVSCSSSGDTPVSMDKKVLNKEHGRGPSVEQLEKIKDFLIETVPKFFKIHSNYGMYHSDIVFENNYWGENIVSKGLSKYVIELNKIRILSYLNFAHVGMNVIKVTTHKEDGTVRVHWRIVGLPQLKTLQFWKFMPWSYRKSLKTESKWYDGISLFHVGTDGLIHKHRVDRVMPDEEPQEVKVPGLAVKLGILFGLMPQGIN